MKFELLIIGAIFTFINGVFLFVIKSYVANVSSQFKGLVLKIEEIAKIISDRHVVDERQNNQITNIQSELSNLRTRLNDHSKRIRTIEINLAKK